MDFFGGGWRGDLDSWLGFGVNIKILHVLDLGLEILACKPSNIPLARIPIYVAYLVHVMS